MLTGTCLRPLVHCWLGYLILVTSGCSTAQTSNTARTASEQMLISNAVDYSLDKVDFTAVYGQRVFLEEKYVDCVDKSYVIASVRHRIMKAGGKIVDKPDDADMVMELRSGGVGTNTSESFVGIPEIALPGLVTLPEVRFLERKMQRGTAKLGIVAYNPKTRDVLGNGGMSLAQSDDSNWFVVGVGPFQSGTVRNEVERGTRGGAALVRDHIPPTVAFAPPAHSTAPATQYVAEPPPEPATGVAPVSAIQNPDWYTQQ